MMDNLMTGTRILAWLVGAGHALGRRHRGEQHHDGDREGTHRGDRHSAVPSGQGRATSLQQIMAESIMLTTVAGLAGISFGVFVLNVLETAVNPPGHR